MASRTQLLCLCEGVRGSSIDEVFVNRLIQSLDPPWLRPWSGSNVLRLEPCGSRSALIQRMPDELRACLNRGGNTTLMVWADCDHDCADGESLKRLFWEQAARSGITEEQFARVVFMFCKDRLENWIEFLLAGSTDELTAGSRVKDNRQVADAARKLAAICSGSAPPGASMPASLRWSCANWRSLSDRMRG